jgi:hypothetical protein
VLPRNCAAATFGDVAARNRNETADSGRLGAKSAAVRRPSKGRSPTQTAARATPPLLVTRTGQKSSLSHPNFDVAAKIGSPTSTRLGETSPAHRNPRVHDRGSRHTTRKTTESIAHSLPNGRPSEAAGRNPVQKTRLVETFPTTPRSPFLPTEVKILRPKNRRKIDRFRPKISKSAATMPATRASDERGNESDSQRPGMPGPERTVR